MARCECGQRTDVCARYGCHEFDGAEIDAPVYPGGGLAFTELQPTSNFELELEAIRPLIAAVRAVLDLPRGHTPDPTGNDAFDRGYLRGYTTAIDNAQHAIRSALHPEETPP